MLALAIITSYLARLEVNPLFWPYLVSCLFATVISVLIYVFINVAVLATIQADRPIGKVAALVTSRGLFLILPALILPIFLIAFTATKSAIPFLVGYTWDPYFTALDHRIFHDDVWHLVRGIVGDAPSPLLEWIYTVGWGAVFFGAANGVALFGDRRSITVFFTAMFMTWIFGGCVLAYSFSAAGPVFASLFEPSLAARFAPMHRVLDQTLGTGPIAFTQDYLAAARNAHVAEKGGGISAMPSMHVGAISICVLAARGTRWLLPAIAFWAVIFVSSAYFGYHYWVDGWVAAVVAAMCWYASARLHDWTDPDFRMRESSTRPTIRQNNSTVPEHVVGTETGAGLFTIR